MKKNFFTICFGLLLISTTDCFADIIPINDYDALAQSNSQSMSEPQPIILPNPNDETAVRSFFKKRFEEATKSIMPKNWDINTAMSVNIIHTPEYYEQQKERKKSIFQKMYERAIDSLSDNESKDSSSDDVATDPMEKEIATTATRFYTLAEPEDTQIQRRNKIPTVSVALPSGRRILAPAREHIPYFLSYIDIQANGYVKVEDTITVVANNRRLAYGLNRLFSKNTDKDRKIDFILESVTINNTPVPYITEEIGGNIVLTPKYKHKLEPGVYTYKFNYIINNLLQKRQNRWMLDWSLTGKPMNMFITSANAIVSLPTGHSFDNVDVIIGSNGRYSDRRTNRFKLAGNVVAFSNFTPLFQGEDMHVLALMDKNVFLKDFDKNFAHFINTWGNVLYAGIGLLAILWSYVLSLIALKRERKNRKYTPTYNGSLMRSIAVGKYDRVAFTAQLLDLFRKGALDIVSDNERIFLQRKEINTAKLTAVERRGLRCLFARKSDSTEIKNANTMLLKKAKRVFEKSVLKQIKKYRMIHNISYVLFSTAMLILTEIFIASISINFAQTLIILLAATLMYVFYIWILRHRFKHWYTNVPIKLIILSALFIIWIFSSIYIGGICSFLIMLMVVTIFAFTRIFAEHNNFINEAKTAIGNYKEYLVSNADAINLGRGFINQQSNIFALNITEYFPHNINNKNMYRLDAAEKLKQLLIGII